MAISNRNEGVVPATQYVRPVVSLTKAIARMTNSYAPVSFRSALVQAQQRCSSFRTPTPLQVRQDLEALQGQANESNWAKGVDGFQRAVATPPMAPGTALDTPISSLSVRQGGTLVPATHAVAYAPKVGNIGATPKPLSLSDFPRPEGDNGRGMHWIPTTSTSDAVVDRFVREAREMKVKWMVILNDDANVGKNDYLVKQLVANGIMPIMRVYTPNGQPIKGDLSALVKHYREMGVSYYQLYNEPNLNSENPDGIPSVDKYLDKWLPAAKEVVEAGGLPGIGALSPGGNFDDLEFLSQTLDKLKERGEVAALDKAWLGMHNYSLNRPVDYANDSNGFMKFKWYDAIVREKLGRQMPIISTEGGTYVGLANDKSFAPVDKASQVKDVTDAYRYMRNREPYNFAYSYWVIANEEGGGTDPNFTNHALFTRDGQSALVDALKQLD